MLFQTQPFTLDPDNPIFKCHFPSFPIYPGVFLGHHMQEACEHYLASLNGPDLALSEVQNLKFRSPLKPGDTFVCQILSQDSSRSQEEAFGVEVAELRGDQKVTAATGKFFFKPLENQGMDLVSGGSAPIELEISSEKVKAFIPHGPRIRSVDGIMKRLWGENTQRLIDQGQTHISFADLEGSESIGHFHVSKDFYLVKDSLWPSIFQLECLAQCGAFLIYGLENPDMSMDMTLLSASLKFHKGVKAPCHVIAKAFLNHSRSTSPRDFINSFTSSLSTSDGVLIAEGKFNAMATYRDRAK